MTPEQLEQLRAALPPFAEDTALPALLPHFCRYYGLNFDARYEGLEYRAGVVPSGSYSLAVHRWLLPTARHNLLLVHGYFDHTGLFNKLIDYGLSRNCNVLMFDLPGHGLSSGDPAVIDEFADYARAISDVLAAVPLPGLPLWVMAQSTGCAALVEYARHHPWPFSAAVLLAPLVRPVSWHRVRFAHMLLKYFAEGVERVFTHNSSDQEFLQFIQRDPLQSKRVSVRWVGALRKWLAGLPQQDLGVGAALVIQGEADRTVDWRYNLPVIARLFPGSQLEHLSGAGHQLANEADAVRHEYLQMVDKYLGFSAGS